MLIDIKLYTIIISFSSFWKHKLFCILLKRMLTYRTPQRLPPFASQQCMQSNSNHIAGPLKVRWITVCAQTTQLHLAFGRASRSNKLLHILVFSLQFWAMTEEDHGWRSNFHSVAKRFDEKSPRSSILISVGVQRLNQFQSKNLENFCYTRFQSGFRPGAVDPGHHDHDDVNWVFRPRRFGIRVKINGEAILSLIFGPIITSEEPAPHALDGTQSSRKLYFFFLYFLSFMNSIINVCKCRLVANANPAIVTIWWFRKIEREKIKPFSINYTRRIAQPISPQSAMQRVQRHACVSI